MVSFIGVLLWFIEVNTFGFSILIGLLLLTLILNRTTFIQIENGALKISKRNFLFFPSYQFTIELDSIKEIRFQDKGVNIPGMETISTDIEGALLIDLLTGAYFYRPRFILSIHSKQEKLTEIKVNTSKSEIMKVEGWLKEGNLSIN